MTERLHNLLLQSEAGEPAILWGRLAKPFLGKEFDRLLHRGVLIEETPADEWDVCSDCECDHDSRLIQRIEGKLIAACPIDHHSDTVLEPEDLRSFQINLKLFVCELAVASGFTAEPAPVLPGVWYLGLGPAKRALFLALPRGDVLAPGLIATLQRLAERSPITIVAPALPPADLLRFAEASIHYVPTADAFISAGDRIVLDEDKLMPPSSAAARLTVFLHESRIIFDGRDLALSPQNFKLLLLLAEGPTKGLSLVSHDTLEKHLWSHPSVRKTARNEAVRDLREELKTIASGKSKPHLLIQTHAGQGYSLKLDATDIRLVR